MKIIQLLVFGLIGFGISYVCNAVLLRFAESLGIRNKNDVTIRWNKQSKPSLGGVSFFVVFIFTTLIFAIVFAEDQVFRNKEFVGFLLGGSLAFLMGLADDAYNTKPLLKLFCQILCGFILVLTGTSVDLTHHYWIDAFITITFVVGIMNSLNMLDNMDGITGTVCLSILISCLIADFFLFDINTNVWTLIILAQIGGLIAFLKFNLHPSKLFMGDAGSQFIAFFVASISIKQLWNVGEILNAPSWIGFIAITIAFAIPFSDTLTVVINRLKRGQSPMVGGKDHTTHHLVYSGKKDFQVWKIFAFISTGLILLLITMFWFISQGYLFPIAISALVPVTIFIWLYRITLKFPNKS